LVRLHFSSGFKETVTSFNRLDIEHAVRSMWMARQMQRAREEETEEKKEDGEALHNPQAVNADIGVGVELRGAPQLPYNEVPLCVQ